MPRALVTGANGHVGSNLVRDLLDHGWDVVPFVRKSSDLTGLSGLDLQMRYGDILDKESVDAAMEDFDCVFHTAAVYRVWAKDPAEIIRPALEGSEHVIAAAGAKGVKRVVYTSSVVAVGPSSSDTPRTAEDWNEGYESPYVTAKTDAERASHRLADEHGVEMVVVNPGLVLGQLDYRITPSTEGFAAIVSGEGQYLVGGTNAVSVRDVATGHRLAAEKGRPGERYILAGPDNVSTKDYHLKVDALTGSSSQDLTWAPSFVPHVMAFFMEMGAGITGGKPKFTRAMIRDYTTNPYWWFDIEKSRTELGYEPMGLDEVIAESVSWLVHIGAAPPVRQGALRLKFPPKEWWPAPK